MGKVRNWNNGKESGMASRLILILGGVRSGKSALAERLARSNPPQGHAAVGEPNTAGENGQGNRDAVLFVATAEALDDEMKRRIAAHRKSRPAHWHTLEEPIELVPALRMALGVQDLSGYGDDESTPATARYHSVLLDCLTLWVSNMLLRWEGCADVQDAILSAAKDLLDLCDELDTTWIMVSNEVGMGLVPSSALGRAYRDALGAVNRLVALRADRVYLMSAGLALELKGLGAVPLDDVDLGFRGE